MSDQINRKRIELLWDQSRFIDSEQKFVLNSGGVGCFASGTLVVMSDGSKKPIESISEGELVLSFNGKEIESKQVTKVFTHKNTKKTIRAKLKNGQIIEATEDHEFWTKRGWTKLRHILDLFNGNLENNT